MIITLRSGEMIASSTWMHFAVQFLVTNLCVSLCAQFPEGKKIAYACNSNGQIWSVAQIVQGTGRAPA